MRDEIAVVGAGTSGLLAAKELAALGLRTDVYEQRSRIGYPPRASGIISISGLKSLGIDYSKAMTNTLYGANIHSGGAVMRIVSRKPQAHVLDREKLNLVCNDEALRTGAHIHTGKRMDGAGIERLHRDKIIVGADGAVSSVAKHFSMGSISRYTLTYKAEYELGAPDAHTVDLFFDNALAKNFFAWTCPNSKDVLEVGIGIDGRCGNSRQAFERFMKTKEMEEMVGSARMLNGYASLIPMQTMRRVVDAENEVLLVGDAAGQVKPTTGGGVVFGGSAARMAAEVIANHVRYGKSLRLYEKAFRKSFGVDMRLHSTINRIYSSLDQRKLAFLINVSKTIGLESFFAKYGDMDRPSVMLKRFFLRGLAK